LVFNNQRSGFSYINLMFLDLQKANSHIPWQKVPHLSSKYLFRVRYISFQQSFLELRSKEIHKLFLEFPLFHRDYLDRSRQSLKFYRNQGVNFQVLNLYDIPHFCEDIQYQILVLDRICMLIFLRVFDAEQYIRRAHHRLNTPSPWKALYQFR